MLPYLRTIPCLSPWSAPVSKTQHCSWVEYSLKEGMQQPILHSPQALLGDRGANTNFLLESFILSLQAVAKVPLHSVPTQPAVGFAPTRQEGGICTLNLEFAARKTMISIRLIWVQNLGAVSHFSQLFPWEGSCTKQQPQPHPAPHCHPLSSLSNMSVQPQPLPGKHQAQLD